MGCQWIWPMLMLISVCVCVRGPGKSYIGCGISHKDSNSNIYGIYSSFKTAYKSYFIYIMYALVKSLNNKTKMYSSTKFKPFEHLCQNNLHYVILLFFGCVINIH